jgi:hypothetical protein
LVHLGVGGKTILKKVLKYWDGVWFVLVWLRMGTGGGHL